MLTVDTPLTVNSQEISVQNVDLHIGNVENADLYSQLPYHQKHAHHVKRNAIFIMLHVTHQSVEDPVILTRNYNDIERIFSIINRARYIQ